GGAELPERASSFAKATEDTKARTTYSEELAESLRREEEYE
ncbi:MAG: hypothetical protein JWR15_4050, partial [Prosthecobacter sp.]|nr:hypothetical protein [Prosthecobacter sp.]